MHGTHNFCLTAYRCYLLGADCGIETAKPHPERLQEERFAYGIIVWGLKLAINLADQREAKWTPSTPAHAVCGRDPYFHRIPWKADNYSSGQ
jgi:hypothetical protein